jgi:peptidoglycan hydrolase-like protein with peptidoglycan-binding domain
VDYGVGNADDSMENSVDNDVDNDAALNAPSLWKPRFSNLRFQQGNKGTGPREIQVGLNKLGYSLIVDGDFGPKTTAAVIDFQSKHSLAADGVVGEYTWAALIDAINNV